MIKQDTRSKYDGKSGVYMIECLDTGSQSIYIYIYILILRCSIEKLIGSAICFNSRYKTHIVKVTRPERGGNNLLYLAVRKFG
jgi:hypothetical protein